MRKYSAAWWQAAAKRIYLNAGKRLDAIKGLEHYGNGSIEEALDAYLGLGNDRKP
ncbi:MAG: hypothetical protein AABZ04_01720 [Pseudomonadota bacterium]|mgnify:CR=1 FL=1